MKIRGITAEDFVNYKKPSMFLASCYCDWKCCTEAGISKDVCQNSPLAQTAIIDYADEKIYETYINNTITRSIVIGGLEPMLQFIEVISLIKYFRDNGCDDDFVIYTGYNRCEILPQIRELEKFKNVIIKYGRYVPHSTPRYDEVLGITLASDNQYAEQIS